MEDRGHHRRRRRRLQASDIKVGEILEIFEVAFLKCVERGLNEFNFVPLCYRTEEWKPTKPKKGVQVSFLSFSKEERASSNCSFFLPPGPRPLPEPGPALPGRIRPPMGVQRDPCLEARAGDGHQVRDGGASEGPLNVQIYCLSVENTLSRTIVN